MQVEIYTHGTHDQTTAWMCPDFPDNAAVKDDFRKKLRAYIDIRIADEMRRPNDAGKLFYAFLRALSNNSGRRPRRPGRTNERNNGAS